MSKRSTPNGLCVSLLPPITLWSHRSPGPPDWPSVSFFPKAPTEDRLGARVSDKLYFTLLLADAEGKEHSVRMLRAMSTFLLCGFGLQLLCQQSKGSAMTSGFVVFPHCQ